VTAKSLHPAGKEGKVAAWGKAIHCAATVSQRSTDDATGQNHGRSGPDWELLAAIATERPNLMVLGTKGRSNSTDVVVGSTARKLYRESPVPLITIPADFG
jgi:nucleotide-binding universal stress UspA family protein